MAITPTTTIVASPQAGLNRFFFSQISNDLLNGWASAYPAIYENGSNWYALLFHCTNFGALTDNLVWKIAVFKWDGASWARQDTGNEPGVVNPSLHPTKTYTPNLVAVQVGTTLRIPHWSTGGFLAITTFDMATDSFGATNTSALTPGTGGSVAAGSISSAGGMCAAYTANTGKITISADGFSIPISGQDYQRPAYIRYDVSGNTFDSGFTIIGSDSSVVFPQACYGGAVGDCRDAINFAIWQQDNTGQTSSIVFQSLYVDDTVSAVQSTGVAIPTIDFPGNCQAPCGRMICTGTEFVIPYTHTQEGGSGYYNSINVVRATVPGTNILPASWTIEAVHTRNTTYRQIYSFPVFQVGSTLVLPYTSNHFFTGAIRIACAVWSGTWTDGATLSSPLTLLMERGTLQSTDAYITYDFTATATDSDTDNITSGVGDQLFGFVSLTTPICNLALAVTCPVVNTGTIGVFFSAQVVASGGTAPYTYAVTSGALPPGLILDPTTGIISGIPLQAGSFSFSITVTDSLGATATVDAPCPLTIANTPPPPFCIVVPAGTSPSLLALDEPHERDGS